MMLKNFRTYQMARSFYFNCRGLKMKGHCKDQFDRALLSIVLNLAEGSGKLTAKDKRRFYAIAFGWFIHLLLDCGYGGELIRTFFWPLPGAATFCPLWNIYPWAESIDAILLVLWLVHEEVHSYIKDYF